MDPFLIQDQTLVCFSGGRTSAYLLWRVLQSNNGLPDNTLVLFANTGKELEPTLKFVYECGQRWGVPITWLEYRDAETPYEVVSYETASRKGEPFEALIKKKNYVPNPIARYCTVDLKILTFERYVRGLGWEEWDKMIGIRADEPRRAAKIRANPSDGRKGVYRLMPLVDANVTRQTVSDFWNSQDFDLGLPNVNGVTYHGNCDLCFLKNGSQLQSLINESPERAVWWAAQEKSITNPHIRSGDRFRQDRPSYEEMLKFSQTQQNLFDPTEDSIPCFCGD